MSSMTSPTIFLSSTMPLQTVSDYTVTTTSNQTIAFGAAGTFEGIPIVNDRYLPPGQAYLISNNIDFVFKENPLFARLRSTGSQPREVPAKVQEPEVHEFERSISFDD